MGVPLRVLFIDDSEDDVALQVRLLLQAGYDLEFERVDSPPALTAALNQKWHVIISDYSMPHFMGTDALKLVRDRGLDIQTPGRPLLDAAAEPAVRHRLPSRQ